MASDKRWITEAATFTIDLNRRLGESQYRLSNQQGVKNQFWRLKDCYSQFDHLNLPMSGRVSK